MSSRFTRTETTHPIESHEILVSSVSQQFFFPQHHKDIDFEFNFSSANLFDSTDCFSQCGVAIHSAQPGVTRIPPNTNVNRLVSRGSHALTILRRCCAHTFTGPQIAADISRRSRVMHRHVTFPDIERAATSAPVSRGYGIP